MDGMHTMQSMCIPIISSSCDHSLCMHTIMQSMLCIAKDMVYTVTTGDMV